MLPLLRLWGSRLFWLLIAVSMTVLVAHLPAGFVPKPDRPIPVPRTTTVRTDPTEPLLIEPWDRWQGGTLFPLVWSPDEFARQVRDYAGKGMKGELTYPFRAGRTVEERPVMPLIKEAWLKSLLIFSVALGAGGLLGLLLGTLVIGPRPLRILSLSISVGGLSLPDFCLVLLGQVLTIWTYKHFDIRLWTVGVPGGDRHWALPILALSIAPLGYAARLTAAALDDIMKEDYIRTARSKGIAEVRVIFGHAFRNALPRILNGAPTMINVTLSSLVIVELLTTWPGLGRLLVPGPQSAPSVVATAGLVFCLWFAVLDGVANTLRILANPRLKEEKAA